MFEFEFEGFWVVVDSVFIKEPHNGSPFSCDSDLDYYGYCELDFEVFNSKGEPVWDDDIDGIEEEIIKRYKAEQEEARIEAQLEAAYF